MKKVTWCPKCGESKKDVVRTTVYGDICNKCLDARLSR